MTRMQMPLYRVRFQWYTGTFSVCIAWKQRIGFWLRIRKGYKKIWRSEFTEKISHRRKITIVLMNLLHLPTSVNCPQDGIYMRRMQFVEKNIFTRKSNFLWQNRIGKWIGSPEMMSNIWKINLLRYNKKEYVFRWQNIKKVWI